VSTAVRPDESQDQARVRQESIRAALRLALGDRDERIRSAGAAVFQRLGESAVADLTAALNDPAPAIRAGAARTLAALCDDAQQAVGELRRHQSDADSEVRRAVESALRAIDECEHFDVLTTPVDR
jgi:HEAT repeat protein